MYFAVLGNRLLCLSSNELPFEHPRGNNQALLQSDDALDLTGYSY